MERREFSAQAARLLLGGAAVSLAGCGGGGSSPAAASEPTLADATGEISKNHGHVAVVTGAQLRTGGAIELDIQGTSSHPHTVSLTAADLQAIRSGGRVEKVSSADPHTHVVVFNP